MGKTLKRLASFVTAAALLCAVYSAVPFFTIEAKAETHIDERTLVTREFSTDGSNSYTLYMKGLTEDNAEKTLEAITSGFDPDSEIAFGITDPGFTDCNKIYLYDETVPEEDSDSNLCWAASMCNLMTQCGWTGLMKDPKTGIPFTDEDDLFEYVFSCFENDGYYVRDGLCWIISGARQHSRVREDGYDGYYRGSDGLLRNLCASMLTERVDTDKTDFDRIISMMENHGAAIETNGHAITLMGVIRDNISGLPAGIIIADSDDCKIPEGGNTGDSLADRRARDKMFVVCNMAYNSNAKAYYYYYGREEFRGMPIRYITYLAYAGDAEAVAAAEETEGSRDCNTDIDFDLYRINAESCGSSLNVYFYIKEWSGKTITPESAGCDTIPVRIEVTDGTGETVSVNYSDIPVSIFKGGTYAYEYTAVTEIKDALPDGLPSGEYTATVYINCGPGGRAVREAYYLNNGPLSVPFKAYECVDFVMESVTVADAAPGGQWPHYPSVDIVFSELLGTELTKEVLGLNYIPLFISIASGDGTVSNLDMGVPLEDIVPLGDGRYRFTLQLSGKSEAGFYPGTYTVTAALNETDEAGGSKLKRIGEKEHGDNVLSAVLDVSMPEITEENAGAKVTYGESVTYYETLTHALNEAPQDSVVTLLEDADFSDSGKIEIYKNITIDLNGKRIFFSDGGKNSIDFLIKVYAVLTLTDSKGTGEVYSDYYWTDCIYVRGEGSKLILSNVTVNAAVGTAVQCSKKSEAVMLDGTHLFGQGYAVYIGSSKLTVYGGKIESEGTGIFISQGDVTFISGDISSGDTGIFSEYSKLLIEGGSIFGAYSGVTSNSTDITIPAYSTVTVRCTEEAFEFGDYPTAALMISETDPSYNVLIAGGTFIAEGRDSYGIVIDYAMADDEYKANVTVSGGKFYGAGSAVHLLNPENVTEYAFFGGKYSSAVTEKIAPGFVLKDNTGDDSDEYPYLIAPENAKGDFDGDGRITVSDALAALRIAAELVPEDTLAVALGDVDGDGYVTVADALMILRVAVKLADTL